MAKSRTKTVFICQQCGYTSPKWVGRCPNCEEWNTMLETVAPSPAREKRQSLFQSLTPGSEPLPLTKVSADGFQRIPVPVDEFNHTLGGGIVPGSVVLIGGDPGIGKSTLLLQISVLLAEQQGPVLYISGEESVQQIKMRADRLGSASEKLYVLAETELNQILAHIERMNPRLVIVRNWTPRREASARCASALRPCCAWAKHGKFPSSL